MIPCFPSWLPVLCMFSGLAPADNAKKLETNVQIHRLPLRFMKNAGQVDGHVQFVAKKPGILAFFTKNAFVLNLAGPVSNGTNTLTGVGPSEPPSYSMPASGPCSLFLTFEGASPDATIEGLNTLETVENDLHDSDSNAWTTDIPCFDSLRYRGLYSGIDLIVYDKNDRLEYDIIAEPGADISQVIIRCDGARGLNLQSDGELDIALDSGRLHQGPPIAEQRDKSGQCRAVPCTVFQIDGSRYGFKAPEYDIHSILRIDPGIEYCTFLGGSSVDDVGSVAVDETGTLYCTGATYSSNFPSTPGAFNTTFSSSPTYLQSFVAKLNSTGTQIIYSTSLHFCGIGSISLNASHAMYFCGAGTKGYPTTPHSFNPNGYILQQYTPVVGVLNSTGNALIYSSYIGGQGSAQGLVLESSGIAYVCGGAGDNQNSPFPKTPGTFQTTNGSVFIVKINANGTALMYSSLFGASAAGVGGSARGIAIDAQGAAYIAGIVDGPTFPVTTGAPQTTFAGGTSDAFVSKLSADSTKLEYSTYLGSPFQYSFGDEQAWAIAVDSTGSAYVAGAAAGPNFPTTPGAFQTNFQGVQEIFITKLNPSGTGLIYSTYLGGSSNGSNAYSLKIDANGDAMISGSTSASDFPTTSGCAQPVYSGGPSECQFVELDSLGSGLLYSTFLGGSFDTSETGSSIAVGLDGTIYLGGVTNAPNFPVTLGAFDTLLNGNGAVGGFSDGWLAKVTLGTPAGVVPYGTGTLGCAGAQSLVVYSTPKVGNPNFEFTCSHCPGDSLGLLLITNQSYATDSDPFGIGLNLLVDLFSSSEIYAFDINSNSLGGASVPTAIPNNSLLGGNKYYAQVVSLWPSGTCTPSVLGLSSSNALAITIQP
ncbi:MAG: hypothetical protein HY286_08670 [Planctomycetes bacterium]|nr:hypothetical protein [Planctomycetota bacterium]